MAGTFFGRRLEEQTARPAEAPVMQDEQDMEPKLAAMLLNRGSAQKTIVQEDIKRAAELLAKYK